MISIVNNLQILKKLPRVAYFRIGAFVVALLFISGVILLSSGSPFQVAAGMWNGAFGSSDRFARVISTLCPLLLAACGLIFTFTAGLYNLGIEGQITAGAIASTFLLRLIPEGFPPAIAITLAILSGIIGGGIWGLTDGNVEYLWQGQRDFCRFRHELHGSRISSIFSLWSLEAIGSCLNEWHRAI